MRPFSKNRALLASALSLTLLASFYVSSSSYDSIFENLGGASQTISSRPLSSVPSPALTKKRTCFDKLDQMRTPLKRLRPPLDTPMTTEQKFDAISSWRSNPHNGRDYTSALENKIYSIGPGCIYKWTKATASSFGSIKPDGRGPVIWVEHRDASGHPFYAIYGHTASNWDRNNCRKTGDVLSGKCRYRVNWKAGQEVGRGDVIGRTAPFFNSGEAAYHLHFGIFIPKKRTDGSYHQPPRSGWGYSALNVTEGKYVDPDKYFSRRGVLISKKRCELGFGDKRSCEDLIFETINGDVLTVTYWLNTDIFLNGRVVYRNEGNLSNAEMRNNFAKASELYLKKGVNIILPVVCDLDNRCPMSEILLEDTPVSSGPSPTATKNLTQMWSKVVRSKSAKLGSYSHLKYPSWGNRTHFGIDIIDYGKDIPVYPMAAGTVVQAVKKGDRDYRSLGNAIRIKHPKLGKKKIDIYTLYLHLRDKPLFDAGDPVTEDDKIGYIGKTGHANNIPHVHFEIRYFDTLFSAHTGNIYFHGDARNEQWALRDWEDPEIFDVSYINTKMVGNMTGRSFGGCGCHAELTHDPIRSHRSVIFDSDYKRSARMIIDNIIVNLRLSDVDEVLDRNHLLSSGTSYRTFFAGTTIVRIGFIDRQTVYTSPENEVTDYDIVITVIKDDLKETIKASGYCGC